MHKNPLQNTGKGIKGTLFFETFRGSMPRNPLEVSAPSVQVGQIHVCPPKISRPVRLWPFPKEKDWETRRKKC